MSADPASSRLPARTDVLIVGAGPTGMSLAAGLRQGGIDCVIVDAVSEGQGTSRAAVIHARTLEVLDDRGVTAQLIARGRKVDTFRIRDRDRTLMAIDFKRLPSPYPFTLMLPQSETEAILRDRLRELGAEVVRPCRLLGLQDDGGVVRASVDLDGRRYEIGARYLVGADGMHSTVREQAGIAFAGAAYQQSFILADVVMDWSLPDDEVTLFFSPEGLMVVAPLPLDRHRIVVTLDDAPASPSLDDVQQLLARRGPRARRAQAHELIWSSRFRVHHRVASAMRRGSVLLAGDAAHVHSPAGGQGMNTGIQDAVSLADALAVGLSASRNGRVLDSWADKRLAVARDVVRTTDRLTRLATMRSALGQTWRNRAMSVVDHVPLVTGRIARKLAEIDAR